MFSPSVYTDATLHVPLGCTSDYQAHSLWGQFYNIADDASDGISAVEQDGDVSIVGGDGNIEVSGTEGVVSVYGMDGSIVAQEMVNGDAEIVLHRGVYIVMVSDGKKVTTKKIMVK